MYTDSSPALPPLADLPRGVLTRRVGRYVTGADTFEVRAGRNYLYVPAASVPVPSGVMFFAQDSTNYTALILLPGSSLVSDFDQGRSNSLVAVMPEGRRLEARQLRPDSGLDRDYGRPIK